MSDLPEYTLEGKVALVAGASRGLGRAISLALAAAGADIALGVRDPDSVEDLKAQIAGLGRRCVSVPMDVLNLDQSYDALERVIRELGTVDVLVNNVGGGIGGPLENFTEADFDWTINFNLKSSFFIAQRAAKHMIERGRGGVIINVASQAGIVVLPDEGLYCIAKAALIHMTKCMAVEWGRHEIRVNAVAPTFIETDGTADALSRPGFREDVIDRIAGLHRVGRVTEVSGAVAFLAAPAASLITGHTLVIDGGWTVR